MLEWFVGDKTSSLVSNIFGMKGIESLELLARISFLLFSSHILALIVYIQKRVDSSTSGLFSLFPCFFPVSSMETAPKEGKSEIPGNMPLPSTLRTWDLQRGSTRPMSALRSMRVEWD